MPTLLGVFLALFYFVLLISWPETDLFSFVRILRQEFTTYNRLSLNPHSSHFASQVLKLQTCNIVHVQKSVLLINPNHTLTSKIALEGIQENLGGTVA